VIAASASSSRWGGRFNAETLIDDMRTAIPAQGGEVPRAGRVLAVADASTMKFSLPRWRASLQADGNWSVV
jgi:hypothetical protein